jgi:hypothetical protein
MQQGRKTRNGEKLLFLPVFLFVFKHVGLAVLINQAVQDGAVLRERERTGHIRES